MNQNFLSEKFHFLVKKFSVYLNRHFFFINTFQLKKKSSPIYSYVRFKQGNTAVSQGFSLLAQVL